MKIWCFIFADPRHALASARVAAPDKRWAKALLGIPVAIDGTNDKTILCHCLGAMDCEIGVIETVPREAAA